MNRMILFAIALFAATAALSAALALDRTAHGQAPADAVAANAAAMILLPTLTFQNDDSVCRAMIAAQNVGDAPAKAALIAFEHPSTDEANCTLTLDPVRCSGLIRPGATWYFGGVDLPTNSRGAVIFSLSTRRLSEIGAGIEPDDTIADYLCTALQAEVAGFCEGYARFQSAWIRGGTFAGIPLDMAAGSPLVVQVLRHCPGDQIAGVEVSATHAGVPASRVRRPAPAQKYVYRAAPIRNDTRRVSGANRGSILYLQNAGDAVAIATVRMRDAGTCDTWKVCSTVPVSPGVTVSIDADTCVARDRVYTAQIESNQPLAVVVDTVGDDGMATFAGVPRSDDGALAESAGLPSHPIVGSTVGPAAALFSPIRYDEAYGWDNAVTVQNHDEVRGAQVDVTWYHRGGGVAHTVAVDICPGGARMVALPLTDADPGLRTGSVGVASRPPAGDPGAAPPPISAVIEGWHFNDDKRTMLLESYADNLTPALSPGMAEGTAGPRGSANGAWSGTGVVALPMAAKNLDGFGFASEIAIGNRVRVPGWTDVAIMLRDANGPVQTICRRIGAGEVVYTNIYSDVRIARNGFLGGAVVSATHWSHGAAGGAGAASTSGPVDLAAAVVTRTGTYMGEDIPGDEVAITTGTPLSRVPAALAAEGRLCRSGATNARPPATTAPADFGTIRDAARAGVVMLPVLVFQGQDDVCRADLVCFNRGDVPIKAMIVAWDESFDQPGSCSPTCDNPVGVTCTGLIAPGRGWAMPTGQLPASVLSAAAYSFSAQTLGELGIEPGSTVTAADAVCSRLKPLLFSDCNRMRTFHQAYLTGAPYEGFPLDQVAGGALEIAVTRHCPADISPGLEVTADYIGLPGTAFLPPSVDPVARTYNYTVNPFFADQGGFNTVLYLQNAGTSCTSVTLAFGQWGDCLNRVVCRVMQLAPGETYPFDATDCVGPDMIGSVVVTSGQPLAVAVDYIGQDTVRTRTGAAGDQPFDLNRDGTVDSGDIALVDAALGSSPGSPGWDPRADLNVNGTIDLRDRGTIAENLCRWVMPPSVAEPSDAPAPRLQIQLPTLLTGTPACTADVAIQNVGAEPAKAVIVLWRTGTGGTECAGPSVVDCTGLIKPGAAWHWSSTGLAESTRLGGGAVFTFSGRTFDEAGLAGGSGVIGDTMCARLRQDLVDDCAAFRRFRTSYDTGADYAGIALSGAYGGELAADVRRTCNDDPTPDRARGMAYEGFDAGALGTRDPDSDRFSYFVPLVYADLAGFETRFFIRNAGVDVATVAPRFLHVSDCSAGMACTALTIQPGGSAIFDSMQCAGPDWQGSAWFQSTQPLAIAVEMARNLRDDTASGGANYVAVPSAIDPVDGAPGTGSVLRPPVAGRVAYGPLLFDPEHTWDTGVYVQNTSLTEPAMVQAVFLDSAGTPFAVQEEVTCPGGMQTLFLPTYAARAGIGDVGSIRVVSYAVAPGRAAPPIAAVALLVRYTDPQRSATIELMAYNLLPESQGFTWPAGDNAGETAGGTGVVALPDVIDAPAAGDTSDLVITNLVPIPGRTDVAITLVDGDGSIGTIRRTLSPGHTTVIRLSDLRASGAFGLPPDFRGSAIVSATSWTHAVAQPGGSRRPLVGLAAAVVRRDASAPGDPAPERRSVTLGRALRQAPAIAASGGRWWPNVYLPYAGGGR